MITEEQAKTLNNRFDTWQEREFSPAPRNPENFRESVLAVFARDEERQRNDRNTNEALDKALRHTQKAIEALTAAHAKQDGFKNNRTHKLLDSLKTAYYEAGEPKDTSEHHISYYDSASDSWMHSVLTATKNQRSHTARLIFDLEALWFSEFGERPTTADESNFFIFAGDMMRTNRSGVIKAIDPSAVKKQRSRTVPPIKEKEDK
jgi:hypothetical protein